MTTWKRSERHSKLRCWRTTQRSDWNTLSLSTIYTHTTSLTVVAVSNNQWQPSRMSQTIALYGVWELAMVCHNVNQVSSSTVVTPYDWPTSKLRRTSTLMTSHHLCQTTKKYQLMERMLKEILEIIGSWSVMTLPRQWSKVVSDSICTTLRLRCTYSLGWVTCLMTETAEAALSMVS